MIELNDVNMWDLYEEHEWATFCITTNGFVKSNGEAVMGRGIAKQAADRFPGLSIRLGRMIKQRGSRVHSVGYRLVSFPVKPMVVVSTGSNVVSYMQKRFPVGTAVPGWAAKADLDIIVRSLEELAWMYENMGWATDTRDSEGELLDPFDAKVFLPRPGCGAGELKWEQVKLLCAQYGDWLVILSRERR